MFRPPKGCPVFIKNWAVDICDCFKCVTAEMVRHYLLSVAWHLVVTTKRQTDMPSGACLLPKTDCVTPDAKVRQLAAYQATNSQRIAHT